MRLVGNVLWVIFGGMVLALLWFLVGCICCCTIVGIPLGIQCFKFGSLLIWPFGSNVVYSNRTGSFLLNLLWLLLFGWELALFSVIIGIIWCVSIVGIPFGIQFIKFARLAITPFGAEIIRAHRQ